jgi:hypothetical protein
MAFSRPAMRLADEFDEVVSCGFAGGTRAGVTRSAGLVNLSSRYSREPNLGSFRAPDWTVTVPDPSWRAGEAGARGDCGDEESEHLASIERPLAKPS